MAAEIGAQCAMQEMDAYVYSTSGGTKTQRGGCCRAVSGHSRLAGGQNGPAVSGDQCRAICKAGAVPSAQFLAALVQDMEIYEHTMATAIGPGEVLTPGGVIHAKAVVLATHFPIVNVPGFFFFRMHQERSYVLALENAAPVGGMYIGEEKNSLSFRDAEGLLLFGGAGTRTGKNREGGNFEQLMQSAKVFYPACKAVYRWAAQDCMPHDQIPYIGLLSEKWPGVYVATGFQKWGDDLLHGCRGNSDGLYLRAGERGRARFFPTTVPSFRQHAKAADRRRADGLQHCKGKA